MSSNHNTQKVRTAADEAHIRQMVEAEAKADRQDVAAEKQAIALADSKFKIDTFVEEGHIFPQFETIYDVNDKGVAKLNISNFEQWAVHDSGEHFVSFDQGQTLYIYKDGVYIPGGLGWLKACMYLCNKGVGMSKRIEGDIINLIGYHCMHDREAIGQDPNITAIGNCVLNTLTGECQDYDPDHVVFSKLAVEHIAGAQCPVWDEFLAYTLEEDDCKSLQELFGYCLVAGYPYHAAWFLLGSGQNGKGVSMNVLRAMLGKRNCSAVALQEVNERFYSHDLYNKYANISGDTSPKALCDASMYKMLTGGDEIRVEQKGKDAFDFVNHAKIISSMNELMKTTDQTDGFFRRFVLIRFAKNITAQRIKEKEGFEQEIINNEMSGVLNWAIEGLKRVRAQGGFTFQIGKSKDALRKIWNVEADHVQGFVDACCEVGPKRRIAMEVFIPAYLRWHTDKYGVPPKEDQGHITKNASVYGFAKNGVEALKKDKCLWLNTDGYERDKIKCYTGISFKNTSGHLDVDNIYLSDHWDEITGGD